MDTQLSVDTGLRMVRVTETHKSQAFNSNYTTTSGASESLISPTTQNNITSNVTNTQRLTSSEDDKLSVCNDTSLPKNYLDLFNCTTPTSISNEQSVSGSHS